MQRVDYVIVGQGIAGTILTMKLMAKGCSVIIIDNGELNTSTEKAAGLYNPITGRKMVKTWMADALFDGLETYYKKLETELGSTFLYPMPIYRPFYSHEEANDWQGKLNDEEFTPFVDKVAVANIGVDGLLDDYGGIFLKNCGYVDLPQLRLSARKYFQHRGVYKREVFQYENLIVNSDSIQYGELESKHIIFCEGPRVALNPFWNDLPFRPVKGEIIKIKTNMPDDKIVNRGVFVVPKQDSFSVGSTYDHKNLDYEPTEKGVADLRSRLAKLFNLDYDIINKVAGVRPATYDRRPFLGTKLNRRVGIFNGFGTKGVSLVPYFADQFINYLNHNIELIPEVDVNRVIKD